jgi:hypothetical protein
VDRGKQAHQYVLLIADPGARNDINNRGMYQAIEMIDCLRFYVGHAKSVCNSRNIEEELEILPGSVFSVGIKVTV